VDSFVLVLDDYHVIDAIDVHQALTFLLEHLPPTMHLVITTREDPPLPLARYRARGQLLEMRAADLRFTEPEAADFLNDVMGLKLSPEQIAALKSRTEGWVAGLQLAALSMQGHDDIPGFIRSFAGDHRYIVDYLLQEVMEQQPERVQTFLLHTSILDRLCGPLCDAVTGQEQSSARLETLERGNFFVVPLDDKRHWYRYHHLFAGVLQARLMAEQPEQIAVLHRRASVWYEQQGLIHEAVRHALAAEDFGRVAELLEFAKVVMGRNREGPTYLTWLKALPEEMISARPVLCVGYAWASMASGELDAVEPWLQRAEAWLARVEETNTRPAEMVVANEEDFARLAGNIAIYRAGRAQLLGNVAETLKYARQVLDIVPEEDHLGRGAGTALLGLALWASGDLETAYQTYAAGMARVKLGGNISDVINSANYLADISFTQGRLAEAMNTYEESLRFAAQQGEPFLPATADHYVGMSELHYEVNDLEAAEQCLLRGKALSERSVLPQNRSRWCVAMARIKQARGDLSGALSLLDEAGRVYVRDFKPYVRPVAAFKARMWVSQGRLGEALGWVREQALSSDDDLSYLREFEHITLARVLLARHQSDPAEESWREVVHLLDRLLEAAEQGGRTGSVIEILLLQALAHQGQGDLAAALPPLHQALALAEPEGYIRTFVDETFVGGGAAIAQLLREAAARGMMPVYSGKLLAALGSTQSNGASLSPLPHAPILQPLVAQRAQSIIEPLSERELEVLRLFNTELSGPEIADKLVIALSTVRTHTKGIYSKLNVNSRREAVMRATELHLI
jgi:LuxR family maltose regulon positive regulatory protein